MDGTAGYFSPVRVSVVIPTLDPGPDALRSLIAALRGQEGVVVEIVIVDSTSTDGSAALLPLADVAITIPRHEFDHGGTRNRAAQAAHGDVLVFMTQDARPLDGRTLERLVAPIVAGDAVAAYARQVAPASAPLLERVARDLNYPATSALRSAADVPALGIRAFLLSDVASAVSRSAFTALGGFPTRVVFNEDLYLANAILTSGGRIAYVADATVEHGHTYGLKKLLRRYFDNGMSLAEAPEPLRSARSTGSGARFAMAQLRSVLTAGRIDVVPRWVAETVVKLVGFRLGRRHRRLPLRVRRMLSLQPAFHAPRPADDPPAPPLGRSTDRPSRSRRIRD